MLHMMPQVAPRVERPGGHQLAELWVDLACVIIDNCVDVALQRGGVFDQTWHVLIAKLRREHNPGKPASFRKALEFALVMGVHSFRQFLTKLWVPWVPC